MNLLKETKEAISESGHNPSQIVFIGSEQSGHSCSWDEFVRLANVEYDDGYGAAEVAKDLIIVFRDGSKLWRREYDGSEWWAFSTPFRKPKRKKKICGLVGAHWPDLSDLCNSEDRHNNPRGYGEK